MWIEFHVDGQQINVPCQENEAIYEIFPRCETKLQRKIDMRFVNFIYNGNVAKNNIPLAQVINEDDRKRNVLSILVNKNDFDEITHNSITCPKCFCEAEMSWEGYKAKLKCPNGHFFNNLSVREFEKTQELELSKIVCDICKETKFIYCNPENFLRTFARLGLNIINRENVLNYFNLNDHEHTGKIKYKDFIT